MTKEKQVELCLQVNQRPNHDHHRDPFSRNKRFLLCHLKYRVKKDAQATAVLAGSTVTDEQYLKEGIPWSPPTHALWQ